MDLLPTIAALADAKLAADRAIDGHDIGNILFGAEGAPTPTKQFLYYTSRGKLAGIRQGPWKLLLETSELFHVEHDISEQWNVASKHAGKVATLRKLAQELDAKLTAEMRPTRRVTELLFDPSR